MIPYIGVKSIAKITSISESLITMVISSGLKNTVTIRIKKLHRSTSCKQSLSKKLIQPVAIEGLHKEQNACIHTIYRKKIPCQGLLLCMGRRYILKGEGEAVKIRGYLK